MADFNYYKEFQGPGTMAPRFGTFWLYSKIDFSKIYAANGAGIAADESVLVFKVKDKWLLTKGFQRTTTVTDGDATFDVGVAADGNTLDDAADCNAAVTDWTAMDSLAGATEEALTADGYIYLTIKTNTVTSGVIELAIEVFAGPDDAEGTDSLTED